LKNKNTELSDKITLLMQMFASSSNTSEEVEVKDLVNFCIQLGASIEYENKRVLKNLETKGDQSIIARRLRGK
jgi:UDP-N-acetylglucosamine enolpyruvyl transferase